MSVEQDFEPAIALRIMEELSVFGRDCNYDDGTKKIVYDNAVVALHAYNQMQMNEMEKFKWIESEKAHADLGEKKCTCEWMVRYSSSFREYWKKTHSFVI